MYANCCSAKMRDHGANDRNILSTRTTLVRRRTSAGHRRTTYCDRLNSTMDKVSFLDELQDRLAALMGAQRFHALVIQFTMISFDLSSAALAAGTHFWPFGLPT